MTSFPTRAREKSATSCATRLLGIVSRGPRITSTLNLDTFSVLQSISPLVEFLLCLSRPDSIRLRQGCCSGIDVRAKCSGRISDESIMTLRASQHICQSFGRNSSALTQSCSIRNLVLTINSQISLRMRFGREEGGVLSCCYTSS